jgi:glucose dehydrogenase
MTWGSSTYDPDLNLLYLGTGNPQPVINGRKRQGDNLFTESIVALNPDTESCVVLPVVAARHARLGRDADAGAVRRRVDGQPRKLLAQASRNGWFFVLDRTNGRTSSARVREDELDEGRRREGTADPDPRRSRRPTARSSRRIRRRAELAATELQPAHRLVLRQRDARVQRVLPVSRTRTTRSRRVGRQRSRRMVGGDAAGDRLQTGRFAWSHKWAGSSSVRSGC